MGRPRLAVLAVVALLAAASGCTGLSGSTADATTTPEATPSTTPTTATTTTTSTTTTTVQYGTQFLYVSELNNQSRYTEIPADRRAHFQNLTAERQAAFERALDGDEKFGPDEQNPFDWSDGDRPLLVRYDGIWYRVQVAIV